MKCNLKFGDKNGKNLSIIADVSYIELAKEILPDILNWSELLDYIDKEDLLDAIGRERCMEYFDLIPSPPERT